MYKFIHTSDWHLGMQAYFLPDEARARFAQDRFAAVERIAELAADEACAFVVVAGDVFDSNHVDRRVVAKAVDALATFSVPVFLLPGNHDPLDPSSVYFSEAWTAHKPDLVTLIDEITTIPVPGADGIKVIGDPWRTKRRLSDPAAACYEPAGREGNEVRVMVAHGVVDYLSPDDRGLSQIDSDALRRAFGDGSLHYAALGDRHSVTEVRDTAGRAWYSGTPVATRHGLVDPNAVLMVTLDADSCVVEPRVVGVWSFRREARDLNSLADVEALGAWLDSGAAKATTVMELALRGSVSLSTHARLDALLDESRLKYASLDDWEAQSDLILTPDDDDLAELEVSGYVREALDQLIAEAGGAGTEAIPARDALNLLHRLAR
jgi:DNA repair exonuclease SbcCD nuclease subunit